MLLSSARAPVERELAKPARTSGSDNFDPTTISFNEYANDNYYHLHIQEAFRFFSWPSEKRESTCPITGRRGAELNYQADDDAIGWAIHPFDGAVGNEALFEKRSATGHR
jgi:hypothetical protein